MWEGVGNRTELQHIDPHSIGHNRFLSRSPGLLNRGPGGPASLGAGFLYHIYSPTATTQSGAWGPTLLGAGFLYRILCPTDWTSCSLSYIIVQRPPSCGRHKSHLFNLSTVKVIFWYSSTGCTCYLHRCISYFDTPAWSEVNIQQMGRLRMTFFVVGFTPSAVPRKPANSTSFSAKWNMSEWKTIPFLPQ